MVLFVFQVTQFVILENLSILGWPLSGVKGFRHIQSEFLLDIILVTCFRHSERKVMPVLKIS